MLTGGSSGGSSRSVCESPSDRERRDDTDVGEKAAVPAAFSFEGPMLSVAVLILWFLGGLPGPGGTGGGDPGKEWCDGPVRYFLTRSEYRRYLRLETPAERSAFVSGFWARLDPDPTTPENEHRASFERLRALADARYEEPLTPGWRTDRGRVLILMGIPDSIHRDAGDPDGLDREIWTYLASPGERAAPVEFVFHRAPDGRFRLGPTPSGGGDPVDGEREQELERVRRELRQRIRLSSLAGERSLLAAMMTPEPERPRWSEIAATSGWPWLAEPSVAEPPRRVEGAGEIEFDDGTYYFRAADGSVLTLLALELDADSLKLTQLPRGGHAEPAAEPAGAMAWILARDLASDEGSEPEPTVARFRRGPDVSPWGGILFVGRAYLEPGSYDIHYAVGNPDRMRLRSRRLRVPDIGSGGFSASSVVLADRFGPATGGELSLFNVGSEEVVPRPGGVFHRGEPLQIYLQVYGATPDPESGTTAIDVEIRFLREIRGRLKRHGRPLSLRGAQGASMGMGLALPIGDWQPGEYRVEVSLHDRVSNARADTEGAFRVSE
jgi:GWxTD domain-containing protein